MNPFGNDVVEKRPKKQKKKKNKKIKRGNIVCTCGALNDYYTTLHYMHDDHCLINTLRGKEHAT